ncbi:MAG: hypothetical protein NDF51_02210 [archaeon YNP-WB-040]|nr:hypothetical protein [Candidatus Culexarchaeum yellowstonense]
MSEQQEKRNYVCQTVDDAIAMLDAVDKFLDNYEKLKRKYMTATKKLQRLFGERERRGVFSFSTGGGMNRAMRELMEQMVQQTVTEVLRKQGVISETEEETEEEEEIEEEEVEKFFEEEKPKEEDKDSNK